jgi:pimeloyl-ACP methyl ester carboxylesterase
MTTDDLLAVHELRSGDGRAGSVPLVLLHGFPVDSRMWAEVAARLPGGRDVLAIDLPGLGVSAAGAEVADRLAEAGVASTAAPALETSADAVWLTLQRRGVAGAIVAGLSMGGYVTMAIVDRHPELVRGLALLDTRSGPDGADAATNRLDVAETVIREDSVDAVRPMATTLLGETSRTARAGLVERLAGWIDDQRPDGIAWSQRAMAARPDRSGVLRRYTGPSLVLVGDEDVVTPVETARAMHGDLVGSTLVVVPQAGHMTAVENPQPVADALADLAARVDGR